MINPAKLLKLKGYWEQFSQRHPKFVRYLQVVAEGYIQADSVLDVTVKDASGRELHSNVRITQEDMELISSLKEMLQSK
ncbi:MAG: hypothetical protein SOV46_08300 [Candidatus Faecousia sp.]|nr:hypothetical protein [Candidatus Faecousia sp.]